jgi:hypothetical protein
VNFSFPATVKIGRRSLGYMVFQPTINATPLFMVAGRVSRLLPKFEPTISTFLGISEVALRACKWLREQCFGFKSNFRMTSR